MLMNWFLIAICGFIIFRLFSLYTKSYWRNDLIIAVAQGFIISLIMIVIAN
ncbi:preprotein translocase subunit Sss1 [Paenibacillus amylolyticus]|uniref:Preprotein translocase subunit Sss1 n=1 Tax=Paenibacillus amylolyticus TaxID=1451 RepID=A0AAP5LRF1_PAEAM|nr:preprotein translocase subunit Sss1 [Paenibacillus amylolyticus]